MLNAATVNTAVSTITHENLIRTVINADPVDMTKDALSVLASNPEFNAVLGGTPHVIQAMIQKAGPQLTSFLEANPDFAAVLDGIGTMGEMFESIERGADIYDNIENVKILSLLNNIREGFLQPAIALEGEDMANNADTAHVFMELFNELKEKWAEMGIEFGDTFNDDFESDLSDENAPTF